jgi:hypothetical protein
MRPERTFWEKATAIHVFCAQGEFRGTDRFARHWHDISRLDDAGYVDRALADRNLARAVAQHKSIFFREKDRQGVDVDYLAAISQSVVGQKTFDFNVDGFAHIGLLPDMIADWESMGMQPAELDPLFFSTEGYIRLWERATYLSSHNNY